MPHKKLMALYHERLASIKRNVPLACDNDRDGVHDLRVDIKRMRAFFDLVEALNSHFHGKAQCKPFRRIARHAGQLRDAQVQQEVFAAVTAGPGFGLGPGLGDYESFLHEREMEGLASFRHFVETEEPLNRLDMVRDSLKDALGGVSKTAAETKAHGRFYNLRNELIILSSEPAPRPEVLHDIRKLAKTAHYTLEILNEGMSLLTDLDGFIAAIRIVHHALGGWHDDDVSLAHLQDFLYTHGIDPSAEPYATLAGTLKDRREDSYREIAPAFAAFNEAALEI